MTIDRQGEDQALIARLLDRQSARDWDAVREILAEDAVFEMPFINERFSGRDHIIARWRPSLERMNGAYFYDLSLRPLADAGWYVGEFRNTCVVTTTGLPYDQRYIAMFHVQGGKIVLFQEYFDTIRLAVALNRVRSADPEQGAQ
jgi:ketosteroid isomerase-like protein